MALERSATNFYNSYYNSINSFEVGNESNNGVNGALRFENITLNRGQAIQQAILGVYVGLKGATNGDLKVRIRGIDEDNTSSWSDNPFGRPETDAQDTANWSLPSTGNYSNHDVTSIVQEIINRGGWNSGNAIGFYCFDNGSPVDAWVYDYTGGTDSKLTITLSSPSSSFSPSPSRSPSASPSSTPSASVSPSSSTSPSPAIPLMAGMKISKSGISALTASPLECEFISQKGVLGKRLSTTAQVYCDSGYGSDFSTHDFGYVPLPIVTVTCYDGTKINVPDTHISDWGNDEVLVEEFSYFANETQIGFNIRAYHYEPVQGGASTDLSYQYTFKILYCFNEMSVET